MIAREPPYPHPLMPYYARPTGHREWAYPMDLKQRRYWREHKALMPLLDQCAIASYLAARVPPGAYVRSMLRVLAMYDAPATLLVLWFDDGCSEEFPCY